MSGKILLIAAGADEVIPKSSLDNLIDKFKDQLHLVEIKKADHQNIADSFLEYDEAILNYIKSCPPKTS